MTETDKKLEAILNTYALQFSLNDFDATLPIKFIKEILGAKDK